MAFPVYTYGGGDTLYAVFNAIAMLFTADASYLSPVAKMGFIFGGVYVGIKAMFKGDIALFTSKWMLPSMIIYMFLFVPKETVWINDESSLGAPRKIDNVPAGIAVFTSIASQVSHYTAKGLEDVILSPNAPRAATGGIMYGAKAVAKIRNFRIDDPALLYNTKEYLRQCYMWPYIIGNFGGLRSEAIKTNDILGFLEQHPAKCFGIKPIDSKGSVGEFKTCAAAGVDIRAEFASISEGRLLNKLGAALGISGTNQQLVQQRIASMTGDTLGFLGQHQRDVNKWVQQAMLLNANREAYDDQREQLGISRVYPELIKMQAARGLAQDTLGSIISGEMSEALIPASAQPVMLSIIILSFIVILPLALMPGGWSYVVNGIKAIIWVCSWPLFYTIIASIGMIQLQSAVGAWGEDGLTLLGQAGFTDLIHLRYAAVQKMISMVPLFSFAVVWGSPYAFSTMAGAVTGASTGAAIGSATADGNLSMNQVSLNNTTKDQHNEAPMLKMGGGIIDDGAMSVMTDSSGNEIITQFQDQMPTNYKLSDSISAQGSLSLSNAKSDLASTNLRHSEQETLTNSQGFDFAKKFVTGEVTSENISSSELDSFKAAFGVSSATQDTDSVSNSQTTGTTTTLGGTIPAPVTAVTGVMGSTSTHATNLQDIRKDQTVQERQAFDSTLDKIYQAAKNGNYQTSSSEDRTLGQSLGTNLTKLDQIAQERAKSQQNVDTLTDQLQYVNSNTATIDRNINNAVIGEIMQAHPDLKTKAAAVRYMTSHRAEADSIATRIGEQYNPFISGSVAQRVSHLNKTTPALNNTGIPPIGSLEDKYKESVENVQEHAVIKDATGAEKSIQKLVENNLQESKIKYSEGNDKVIENMTANDPNAQANLAKLENEKNRGENSKAAQVYDNINDQKEKHKGLVGDSSFVRVLDKIGNDTSDILGIPVDNNKGKKK